MRNPARVGALVLALPGVVAPFLPFVHIVSPLDTIRELLHWGLGREYVLLGAPFFLAIPIAIWQARKLFASRLHALEIAGAYVLSAGAMISVLWFIILVLIEKGFKIFEEFGFIAGVGACLVLIAANVAQLMLHRTTRAAHETTAEAFLLGGYLPNAIFCLMFFGLRDGLGLQIGAYLIAFVCAGYIAAIVLLSRVGSAQSDPISHANG